MLLPWTTSGLLLDVGPENSAPGRFPPAPEPVGWDDDRTPNTLCWHKYYSLQPNIAYSSNPAKTQEMSHTSTLTRRASTTIPRSIRKALGMQLGDTLTWQVLRDGTVLCRHKPADPQRAAVAVASSVLSRQ